MNHDPGGSPSPQQAAEPGGKDYVNARLVRQPQSCVYVPLPARRATLDGRPAREYANCAPSNQRPAESQAARPAEAATKFSVYDEVGPGPAVAAGAPEDVSAPAAGGPGKGVGGPGSGTGDYEVMDFGESSASVDEVFETVNYELLAAAAAARGGQTQGRGRAREGEGQAELEPSAQQVVHACHDYLQGQGADVQEVATRVAVAPQGLRTRERRNSYRQAVSPNWPQPAHQAGHKYETIWFDGARRVARDGTERGRGPPSEEAPCGVGEDLQANLDQCRGSKERLFREKLEELHQLVAGLGGAGWLVAGARDHAALDLAPAPAPAPALTAATSTTSQQQQQLSPPEGGLSPGAPMPPPSHADPPSGSAGPYSPANVVKPSALHPSPSSTLPGGRAAPPPRELPGGGVSSPSQPLALDAPYYSLALLRNAAPGMGTPPPPLHHPNNTTPPRLTHPHPHPTPIIVGDVAYVGGECVRLRHVKAKGEGGERANIPVAPPRFKRNSSVGCLQYGTPDPNTPPGAILQEWRLSGLRDNGQQQGVMGQQGQAGREDEGPPPPSTHKTSTYEFLDPPAAAPAPMPHPHPPFPHPHYVPLPAPKSLPRQTQPQRQASAPQIPEEDWRGRREDTRREDTPAADSSSDTSDEEGIFHKFSAPSIFRKWRTGGGGKQTAVAAPGSPKSTFYASHTEAAEPPSSAALQSPTSPKPLARALGKLRLNSRSVAANFKSYLSQRSGGQGDPEAADDTEGRVNGHPSEGVPPPAAWSAAQKSGGFVGGSSATPTAFTQVLHDYKYPKAIPKKLGGPRDMPPSLRGPGTYGGTGDDDDSCVRARPDQPAPRQQYL